jgi:hypothetical protein
VHALWVRDAAAVEENATTSIVVRVFSHTSKDSPIMKKTDVGPRWLGGSLMIAAHGLRAELLPNAPDDRVHVATRAADVTRYMSTAQRDVRSEALREIAERGAQHGRELSDLGPDPELCAAAATELDAIDAVITRLEDLHAYAVAWRTVVEAQCIPMLADAAVQATPRIERGILPADSYAKLQRYAAMPSEAIVDGRARAKRAREVKTKAPAVTAVPANDVQGHEATPVVSQPRTGTDGR